jgi:multidrug efflux pump
MIISILLVIMVVFVFLREIRSTLIPSVAVPLSLLGTFGVMYLLDYTLDNLSLMALTISTGFVVDDAIVVIENISRHLESGKTPFQAAMDGSREIGFTVVSMSTSLIAVFIPILLMGGIVGRLFREFAITLSAAILVSLMVSLTTTPMLSAKFLEPHSKRKHGRFYRLGERALSWLSEEYERGLKWVLQHQGLVLTITILTFALNVYLYIMVPKGFFPQQDAGRIGGQIRGQQDVSFDAMKPKVQQIAAIVGEDPGVENVMSFVGGGGPGGGGSNMGNMFVSLKPDADRIKRGDTADVIINRLRPKTAGIPGATLYLQAFQELRIGGRGSATQYQYTLMADTLKDLDEWAPKLMAAMQKLPELKDVATDQQDDGLRAQLVIDRDTASRLGVSPLTIDATLSDAFGQRQVSTTYRPLNQYHVVMEVAPEYQRSPDALKNIYVKSTTGAMVPLSAITHYETQRIPLTVNHQSQSPAATLSFNLTPGVSLSEATTAIEQARVNIGMPSTIHGGFAGTAQAFQSSLSSEPMLILLALVAVYIVLGMLYESFIHPLTILSTLPSAGVGAIVALLLFKVELSVIAMIGIILLIGIVKKNAIMMIDFALAAERLEGKTPEQAIYQACLLRFRPIMMTTMAALLGGLPLALGRGTGSELRRPLGITIVGGLIVSQCLTLFTTPVVYLFFDRLRMRFARLASRRQKEAVPQTVAGD